MTDSIDAAAAIIVCPDGEIELYLPEDEEDDIDILSGAKLLTACYMKMTEEPMFVEELIQWINDRETEERVLQ